MDLAASSGMVSIRALTRRATQYIDYRFRGLDVSIRALTRRAT